VSAVLYSAILDRSYRGEIYIRDVVEIARGPDRDALTAAADKVDDGRIAVCEHGPFKNVEIWFDADWHLAEVASWEDREQAA